MLYARSEERDVVSCAASVEFCDEVWHVGVRSLYAMLRFYAEQFTSSTRMITRIYSILKRENESLVLPDTIRENLYKRLDYLYKQVKSMKLPVTQDSIRRLQHSLELKYPCSKLTPLLSNIEYTLNSELKSILLFQIPNHLSSYYEMKDQRFNEVIVTNFPSILVDFEEASKCIALGRNTASVFHLMRIVECGLRVLGKSLNDPTLDPKKNPTWDRILQRCDKELQAPYAKKTPEWQTHQQFYAEATANLRAVKDAWCNPTLHVEKFYDEEKAIDIWNAVRAFMRHLSTVLSE